MLKGRHVPVTVIVPSSAHTLLRRSMKDTFIPEERSVRIITKTKMEAPREIELIPDGKCIDTG